MDGINWNAYPNVLRVEHLANIYNRKPGGVRRGLYEGSKKLPTPFERRPYGVRKGDCKRHFERSRG